MTWRRINQRRRVRIEGRRKRGTSLHWRVAGHSFRLLGDLLAGLEVGHIGIVRHRDAAYGARVVEVGTAVASPVSEGNAHDDEQRDRHGNDPANHGEENRFQAVGLFGDRSKFLLQQRQLVGAVGRLVVVFGQQCTRI